MTDTNPHGFLTTHVLDTYRGLPASGLALALYSLDGTARQLITSAVTNDDGRCDEPILAGEAFKVGTYELVFQAGDYLRGLGLSLAEPLFIDVVPLRFGISDPLSHYHVPLLLSPFAYSTYRGS